MNHSNTGIPEYSTVRRVTFDRGKTVVADARREHGPRSSARSFNTRIVAKPRNREMDEPRAEYHGEGT